MITKSWILKTDCLIGETLSSFKTIKNEEKSPREPSKKMID